MLVAAVRTVVIHGENMKTAAKLSSYALVAATTLLFAEAASGQMSGPAGKPLPKLVLFMVIDGFPQDQFVKYYDQYGSRAGTSPFNIKVTTVGDELLYANGKSKVVAISGKDRSSIGLAGQFGTAYLYSAETGRFITSDYYMS